MTGTDRQDRETTGRPVLDAFLRGDFEDAFTRRAERRERQRAYNALLVRTIDRATKRKPRPRP